MIELANQGLKLQARAHDGRMHLKLASAFTGFGIDEARERDTVVDMSKYWKRMK